MQTTLEQPHALGRLVGSVPVNSLALRLLAILAAAFCLRGTLTYVGTALKSEPGGSVRDFDASYLLAWALANGVDPNLPLPEIGVAYGVPEATIPFRYPTPHPPTLGLLMLPLAYLPYELAALVWIAISLTSLLVAVACCAYAAGWRPSPLTLVIVAAVLSSWESTRNELWYGQVSLLMVALLSGCWLAFVRGRRILASVLLGIALLLKPLAWPVFAYLLARRLWREVLPVAVVGAFGYGVVTAIVGTWSVVTYLTVSLPAAEEAVRHRIVSMAPSSIGWRLFEGVTEFRDNAFPVVMPPLTVWPLGARLLSTVAMGGIVAVGIAKVWLRPVHEALPFLFAVSVLAAPVVWSHYLLLAFPLIVWLVAQLAVYNWPRISTNYTLVALAGLWVGGGFWGGLSRVVAHAVALIGLPPVIGSLVALTPSVLVATLLWQALTMRNSSPPKLAKSTT